MTIHENARTTPYSRGEIVRRRGFAEAKPFDAAGRLCASATSTLLVFDRPAT